MLQIEFVDGDVECEEEETTLLPRRIARMRDVAGKRLHSVAVVLDNLHDPHNISACLRSCDIFGIQNVHIVHPDGHVKLHRAITRGCQRWLNITQYSDIKTCLNAVRDEGYLLLAADPNPESRNLDEIEFEQPVALVLGAEHYGLSPETLEMADAYYHIQMYGFSQSFNVSVAAAISVQIASSTRRRALGTAGDLTPDQQQVLVNGWIEGHKDRRRS